MLWKNVLYDKTRRYKQEYLYLMLKGYGNNGEINFKQTELLYVYRLPNKHQNKR